MRESIWTRTCEISQREQLMGDIKTEAVVIGAGMAGVLIAYKLHCAGVKAVVLEADRIGSGQTRNTTAKITAQHGCIYDKLLSAHGAEKAQQYARINSEAVEDYVSLISKKNIECDLERIPASIYSINDRKKLEKEAEACTRLGLAVEFEEEPALPFKTVGAVRLREQAQFHPLKFIKAVAEGLTVYEKSPVKEVERNDSGKSILRVGINGRHTVTADYVIFACHFPFVNAPGYYFIRMYQERSYVLALENAFQPGGMYIGVDDEVLSWRNYGGLLLLGGGKHRTGGNGKGGRYEMLRRAAKECMPEAREVCAWSAQDCMTLDDMPYIGRFSADTPDWYVATGFKKWGMTSSMAAANIISKEITRGQAVSEAEVFSPQRFNMTSIPELLRNSARAVNGLSKENLYIPAEKLTDLPEGHGGVLLTEKGKLGVYRESKDKYHFVDVRCPHLGCQLEWNPDEKSWECPCHGSRFDHTGKLISNPAMDECIAEKMPKYSGKGQI